MKSKEGSAKEEKDALTSELQAQTKEKTRISGTRWPATQTQR
jgi:hypothetical protein